MRRLPKSIRKYIRKEKARIRREVLDLKEQEKLINGLYQKFFEKKKPYLTPEVKHRHIEKAGQKTGL